MELEENIALINELERKFPVEQWMIDNVHVWPLIRIPLSFSVNAQESDANRFSPKSEGKVRKYVTKLASYGRGALYQFWSSVNDAKHNASAEDADVLIISSVQDRLLKLPNGENYNIHCDHIADILRQEGKNVLALEIASQNRYRLPRYSKTRFIQAQLDWIRLKAEVDILTSRRPMPNIVLDGYQEFGGTLAERGIGYSLPSGKQLANYVYVIQKTAAYIARILRNKKIRVAMVVDYESTIGMALNLACRQTEIPSVDIQHGVAGTLHGSYGRWRKVPQTGYELLPAVFWCWSEDDAATIDDWNGDVRNFHQAIVGGNSWEELWLDENSDIAAYYDDILAKEFADKQYEKKILVTLQTGGLIPPVVVRAINQSPPSWLWHIRFHPYMTQDERNSIYQELSGISQQANIEFVQCNSLPLMALLRNVDVMITEWSATVIDAKIMKTPSVAVHRYAEEYFPKEIEQGWIRPAYSPEAIIAAIEAQCLAKEKFRAENSNSHVSKASAALKIIFPGMSARDQN